MRRRTLIIMALSVLLLSGNALACQNRHGANSAKSNMHAGHGHRSMSHIVQKVILAVSQAGIDDKQTSEVTAALDTFKTTMMEIKTSKKMPLDAFGDEAFDRELFMTTVMAPKQAKASAKAELIESVYAVLDAEQKKTFKRVCTAPMVEKVIKKSMMQSKGSNGK